MNMEEVVTSGQAIPAWPLHHAAVELHLDEICANQVSKSYWRGAIP